MGCGQGTLGQRQKRAAGKPGTSGQVYGAVTRQSIAFADKVWDSLRKCLQDQSKLCQCSESDNSQTSSKESDFSDSFNQENLVVTRDRLLLYLEVLLSCDSG